MHCPNCGTEMSKNQKFCRSCGISLQMIPQAVAKHLSTADSAEPPVWFQRGVENLKEEVAVLEAQLAELERKNLRSPVLLQKLGEYLGFGAAGKLGWARFKLDFKREQLDRFEAQPETLN